MTADRVANAPHLIDRLLHPDRAKLSTLSAFIQEGVGALKLDLFEKATKHFQGGAKMGEKCGINVRTDSNSIFCQSTNLQTTQEQADELLKRAAAYSSYEPRSNSIKVVNIDTFQLEPSSLPSLELGKALLYLEQWLLALRDQSKASLTGYDDPNLDIASYMINHGLPITFTEIHRLDPNGKLTVPPQQMMFEPHLGKLAYVKRSTGEALMRIVNVDTQNKPAPKGQLLTSDKGAVKPVTVTDLFSRNRREVRPFDQQNISQIMETVDNLGGLQSGDMFYTPEAIKTRIDAVISRQAISSVLPRVGGLRDRIVILTPPQR